MLLIGGGSAGESWISIMSFAKHCRASPLDGMYKKETTYAAATGDCMNEMPVGISDFKEIRDSKFYYVDKTKFLNEILTPVRGIKLFTRPRRFGKSLNISMIDAYLNLKYAGDPDRFEGLKISELRPNDPEKNSNVVVKISLKDLGDGTYDRFLVRLEKTVFNLYQSFPELQASDRLDPGSLEIYGKVYGRRSAPEDLESCLADLCGMLKKHYGKKPVLLIDEYDSVMNLSYGRPKDHEAIMAFMRTFLSTALKDNEDVRFAVVTGVMKISQESIFSGLNNPDVYDLFCTEYDEMFGFTKTEVAKLLADSGHPEKMRTARKWYDGYRFGNQDVYNPWSILKYVDRKFKAEPYWAGTSGNMIISDLLHRTDSTTWKKLEVLCTGGAVNAMIDRDIAYCDLHSSDDAIFSMMVATGYLKAVPAKKGYDVSLPNLEMRREFSRMVFVRFDDDIKTSLNIFLRAIKAGDVPAMTESLTELMGMLSVRILDSEHPYEAFIVGLVASEASSYEILSDGEGGNGYYDVRMKRISGPDANVVMELKRRTDSDSGMSMEKMAQGALDQIHKKRYYSGMKGPTYLYGIAFDTKFPTIIMEKHSPGS